MSDTDLSSRIRQRREQLSLSQEELAARMGYRSKSSITKLEKGINDLPRAKLEELAAALVAELLKGPADPTLKSPFPKGTALLSAEQKGTELRVDLSAAYGGLSGVELFFFAIGVICVSGGYALPG